MHFTPTIRAKIWNEIRCTIIPPWVGRAFFFYPSHLDESCHAQTTTLQHGVVQ